MSLIPYLTRIHFADRVMEDALSEEVRRLGLRRVMLLTDAFGAVSDLAERAEAYVPIEAQVIRASAAMALPELQALYRDEQCDGVVALGGPQVMDRALAVVPMTQPPQSQRYQPVIAIPTTTASLGLPTVPVPVAADPSVPRRSWVRLPSVLLCDPYLTAWAGPEVTAAAGMDVLVHCMETYLSTTWNPPADGMALDGLRRVSRWLERAVEDGANITARREMMAAALCGALAGQKGLGAIHALACAVEAELPEDTPHGQMHAALLPSVLRFNAPAAGDRYADLAEALRLPANADLAQSLRELGARLGLPVTLIDFAGERGRLQRVAARAAEDMANRTNPRHATAEDYRHLIEAAAA